VEAQITTQQVVLERQVKETMVALAVFTPMMVTQKALAVAEALALMVQIFQIQTEALEEQV
jgi:hypothetical protein